MRRIAISDIHGCLQTLHRLLNRIDLQDSDELYFLGDYMDRGPESKGVLDFLMELAERRDPSPVFLRGNHDQMVLKLYLQPDGNYLELANWLGQGGMMTMSSFGLHYNDIFDLPEKYIRFIADMPFYYEVDNFLLVHAGFNFKDEGQFFLDKKAMIWIRRWYEDINYDLLGGRRIVHGHTPTPQTILEQRFASPEHPVVNIDAGCCYHGKVEGMGNLCAYDFTNEELYFEPYCG